MNRAVYETGSNISFGKSCTYQSGCMEDENNYLNNELKRSSYFEGFGFIKNVHYSQNKR